MGKITEAMVKQHKIIEKFLMELERAPVNDFKKIERFFNLFVWALKKHVFIEEENLYSVADKNNPTEIKQLNNLLKDHRDLREIVSSLQKEITAGRKPNTAVLREILMGHEKREIESFYPLLDNRLLNEKKIELLKKVKDIRLA